MTITITKSDKVINLDNSIVKNSNKCTLSIKNERSKFVQDILLSISS